MVTMSTRDVLATMSDCVRRGDIESALAAASQSPIPLHLEPTSMRWGPLLSNGPHSKVWAVELSGGEQAVVKRPVLRTEEALEAFRQEVAVLADIRGCPGAVELLGARMVPPGYFAAMKREGSDVSALLYEHDWHSNSSVSETLRSALPVVQAVAHLHDHGLVHRDIKPANMVLARDDSDRLKLADFGLCGPPEACGRQTRAAPSGGFSKGLAVGTLQYMAPEVLRGEPASYAADVYAIGVVLNELAGGGRPYHGVTRADPLSQTCLEVSYNCQDLTAGIATGTLRPTKAPGIDAELARLLDDCWQSCPESRPAARQVVERLRAIAALGDKNAARERESPAMGGCARQETRSRSCAGGLPPSRFGSSMSLDDLGPATPEGVGDGPGAVHATLSREEDDNDVPETPVPVCERGVGLLRRASSRLRRLSAEGCRDASPANPRRPWYADLEPIGRQPGSTYSHGGTPSFPAGASASAGLRGPDKMEDRHVVVHGALQPESTAPALLAGVFDGHRGPGVAAHLAETVGHRARAALAGSAGPEALLAAVLLEADAACCAGPLGAAQGSTAVLALALPGQLALAWTGDCRAVLCLAGEATVLTSDHVPAVAEERARIEAAGGQLSWHQGMARVGPCGLSVSRAIGNADLRCHGVIARPQTTLVPIRNVADSFLILASDGLWDAVDAALAVRLVHDTVKTPAMCATRLVTTALERGSADNVTAIVIFLDPALQSTHQTAYIAADAGRAP